MNLSKSDMKSMLKEIDCRTYWDNRDHDLHHGNPKYEDNIRVYAITESCQGCVVALNSAYNLLSDLARRDFVPRRIKIGTNFETSGLRINNLIWC